jgi:hypothetical protein
MDSDDKYLKQYKNLSDEKDDPSAENRPDWDTREGMMSEEEVERLSAERGHPEIGKVRADQSGEPGPQPYGDAARRADQEAGPTGEFRRKLTEEKSDEPQKPASQWKKYDWA